MGLNTTNIAGLAFSVRDYRSADFDRLCEIDQRCFPPGISYTQMELSGFTTRRNAINSSHAATDNYLEAASACTRARGLPGLRKPRPAGRSIGTARVASSWKNPCDALYRRTGVAAQGSQEPATNLFAPRARDFIRPAIGGESRVLLDPQRPGAHNCAALT